MDDIPFKIFTSTFHKKFMIYGKNLTLRRLMNYSLVYASLKLKQPRVWGKPLSLFIEPTNICNLKCPLCPTGNNSVPKSKGYMQFDHFKHVIDTLGPTALSVTLWNYGEPFLNKQSFDMIRYAKLKGLKVITSTNGFVFKNKENIDRIIDSGLDEIIFAVDGASAETYNKYRINGNFDELIEGIKLLAEEKKRRKSFFPYMSMQFIIMKNNEHEVEDIQKLAKEIGVDELILKTVYLFNDAEMAEKYLPHNKKYSRYLTDEGVACKTSIRPGCDGLWIGVNINYDGTIVPCCFDTHEKFKFGNIVDTKDFMNEIWNSKKFIAFRKNVWEDKGSVEMCKNCPTNTESQDYARIKYPELVAST
ncbi:MAG TPA: radical SAM protein [Candidatus Nanoarchaeia archaeon]|nr:radical SAM protein [Candidatus Nanoarchaeia archaeon]